MIQIINTGVANIRSLQAAFDRLGEPWQLTENAADIDIHTARRLFTLISVLRMRREGRA